MSWFKKKPTTEVTVVATPSASVSKDWAPALKAEGPTGDFMVDLAEGFKELMHDAGNHGHFYNLTINAPEIASVFNGKAFLETTATLSDQSNKNTFIFIIKERDIAVDHKDDSFYTGPFLFTSFTAAANKSLWPKSTFGVHYKIIDPLDAKTWINCCDGGNFNDDLIKVARFLESAPDPQSLTKFRGIEMRPLLK